ncbi:hypothetical protein AVEN_96925-1 [Araneus ventricosus]|uniref:Receptor ligand binding region domain-containing protein n=1 Tax=Araneus ventricosus TaxID=182803 RepID=A0A4Y2LMY1_ARAVE|nr:hypothetical protein AVEN_96925-1 [Araneus ventricosus]
MGKNKLVTLFWNLFLAFLLLLPWPVLSLPIHLMIALPEEDASKLSKGLRRTIDDFKGEGEGMNASTILVTGNITDIIDGVCDSIQKQNPHVILSFLPPQRTFYISMIAGQAGIPAMTVTRDYTDVAVKVSYKLV